MHHKTSVVYPPTGSRHNEGRWAPRLHSSWSTAHFIFLCLLSFHTCHNIVYPQEGDRIADQCDVTVCINRRATVGVQLSWASVKMRRRRRSMIAGSCSGDYVTVTSSTRLVRACALTSIVHYLTTLTTTPSTPRVSTLIAILLCQTMRWHRNQELKEMLPEGVLSIAIKADFGNPRKTKEKRN